MLASRLPFRVFIGALWLPEDQAGGPDTQDVPDRKEGENHAHGSHQSGLRAERRKVAMPRHCPDTLYAEGARALKLVVPGFYSSIKPVRAAAITAWSLECTPSFSIR